ncbi:ATP-binding protein [Alteriqipengyuania sp. WL0013]|uniref:ATP-binding protein n=1 Tax=Alteriqipengyuania sp. WL0013 TaxID=3110773 RepID=UPI003A5CD56D
MREPAETGLDPHDPGRIAPRFARFDLARGASLTTRILLLNIIPIALLAGSVFYLDSYRRQLTGERFRLAQVEAQIIAEALAGASQERQEALLIQIGKEQQLRIRLYDPEGVLTQDSFVLGEPAYTLDDPTDDSWVERWGRSLDAGMDAMLGAPPVPDYVEPETDDAEDWPELAEARRQGITQLRLRYAPDRTPVITAAAPVGLEGATLLLSRNPRDIVQSVRDARGLIAALIGVAFLVSIMISLYLARTIVEPLRRLARAAVRVRLGRERGVVVPRMSERGDEIGILARATSDMTEALRQRIDAVEAFAADVAHEIKNPLASLRSAIESLGTVDDPALRRQLNDIAAHDVRRIDRLVTEISDASRIEAEMSRTEFEVIDLDRMVRNLVAARDRRDENEGREVAITLHDGPAYIQGVALRLERVIGNLLDNAVSFSPKGGRIDIDITAEGEFVELNVCDQGPGIAPEAREKVFTRFHSVRPDSEQFGNHSGLGLAIARTIAEAHDGTLTVGDRADGGSGACLTLALPAADSAR